MAGPVRQPIDTTSLSVYLSTHVPQIALPIDIKQFDYGQSNPTYQLSASDGTKYVLRKMPPGKLLSPTAHQVKREFRVIHALERTEIPAPKAYCLCEDAEVVGTAFYVMEYLDGRIFEDPSLPDVTAHEREEMWHDAVRVLAKLHRIEPSSVGLSNFGKPSGFYDRQLRTLSAMSATQAKTVDIESGRLVGDIPHSNQIIQFLQRPDARPSDRSTMVHGDFKTDNLVYHRSEPRVIGILDWEMSTIGHPLSDLSNLLSPYAFAVEPPNAAMKARTNEAFVPSARIPGLPTQAQCLRWYAEVAGWDFTEDLEWGNIFATFRNGVIMQGIAARFAQRQASNEKAKEIGDLMEPYGEFCWGLIGRWKSRHAQVEVPKL